MRHSVDSLTENLHRFADTTTNEMQRSLPNPDECMRMSEPVEGIKDGEDGIEEAGDMIVYVAGFLAIYGW